METNEHEHVIEVTDLRRVYGGGFEAVRGIDFSVRRGELFALLGTNGAGKTSTLEAAGGPRRPDRRARCGSSATTRTATGPPSGRGSA